MEAVISIGIGTILALEGWILLEIIKLKVSGGQTDTQMKRIVSDIESEKGTRKRVNEDFERRLRALEMKEE